MLAGGSAERAHVGPYIRNGLPDIASDATHARVDAVWSGSPAETKVVGRAARGDMLLWWCEVAGCCPLIGHSRRGRGPRARCDACGLDAHLARDVVSWGSCLAMCTVRRVGLQLRCASVAVPLRTARLRPLRRLVHSNGQQQSSVPSVAPPRGGGTTMRGDAAGGGREAGTWPPGAADDFWVLLEQSRKLRSIVEVWRVE